ncbi:MAG: hypothetical protein IPF56_23555 [Chloroflexi bacterium]|nr:hypothetical protein [Chloroflexota bacterium]
MGTRTRDKPRQPATAVSPPLPTPGIPAILFHFLTPSHTAVPPSSLSIPTKTTPVAQLTPGCRRHDCIPSAILCLVQ